MKMFEIMFLLRFCWDLEDVVHLSLKVATNKPRKSAAQLAEEEEKYECFI